MILFDVFTIHEYRVKRGTLTFTCTSTARNVIYQVYEVNGHTSSSVASLGCFEDSTKARILSSDMIRSESMTVEVRRAGVNPIFRSVEV